MGVIFYTKLFLHFSPCAANTEEGQGKGPCHQTPSPKQLQELHNEVTGKLMFYSPVATLSEQRFCNSTLKITLYDRRAEGAGLADLEVLLFGRE